MTISLRLNSETEHELTRYAQKAGKSKSELIRSLIAEFMNMKKINNNSWELGKELFGRYGSGKGDLSINRKSLLREKLNAKTNRR
jgi:hypothetical protein